MNPIIKKLYTREELEDKIKTSMKEYEKHQSKNEYEYMTSICDDIATLYEILEDKERSNCYYEKIVDIWKAHPEKITSSIYIEALNKSQRSEEALRILLSPPKLWGIEILARLYEKVGRAEEAMVLYSGLASCSYELYRVCSPFWKPHYLRESADLHEKSQKFESEYTKKAVEEVGRNKESADLHETARKRDIVSEYTRGAVEEWERNKNNLDCHMDPIEEAWLYEEVGYIYEKADKFKTAMEYYEKAKSKYELAYTEEYLASTNVTYVEYFSDGWRRYFGFFIRQIPIRLIHFQFDGFKANNYRRITYRILNLEEKMKEQK